MAVGVDDLGASGRTASDIATGAFGDGAVATRAATSPPPPLEVQAPAGVTVIVCALDTVSRTEDGAPLPPQVVEILAVLESVVLSTEVTVTVSPGFMRNENDVALTATLTLSKELVALSTYWLESDGKMIVTSWATETVEARATAGRTRAAPKASMDDVRNLLVRVAHTVIKVMVPEVKTLGNPRKYCR
jgi:hypothetical protein